MKGCTHILGASFIAFYVHLFSIMLYLEKKPKGGTREKTAGGALNICYNTKQSGRSSGAGWQ